MKRITIIAKLGDLMTYGSIDNEVSASLNFDYSDDTSIEGMIEQLPNMVGILVNSVQAEKVKQENPEQIVKEDEEGDFSEGLLGLQNK